MKLMTRRAPVILLYDTKFFITGTNSSNLSNFCFKEWHDLIARGKVPSVMRDTEGKMCSATDTTIIPCDMAGKSHALAAAFGLPSTMTSVFLPCDLSAS